MMIADHSTIPIHSLPSAPESHAKVNIPHQKKKPLDEYWSKNGDQRKSEHGYDQLHAAGMRGNWLRID